MVYLVLLHFYLLKFDAFFFSLCAAIRNRERGGVSVRQNHACQEQVEVQPQGRYHVSQQQGLCLPQSYGGRGVVKVCFPQPIHAHPPETIVL